MFFRVSVNERLVYRGDFILGTLMRFLPTLTQIFLWWAIYDAVSDGATAGTSEMPDGQIAGFRYGDMVAYYLLVTISRAFSSMPGLATGIALQVREGEIKKFLIQPVDMLGCLMLQRVAHKLVYYLMAALPFAFVFWLCRGFFLDGWPAWDVMIVFLLSLVLSFLLGFFLEACIGLIAFWFLEISSLMFIYMLMNFLLSGHMFPLDLLPSEPVNIRGVVDFLPFKFLAYFPAAVFLGKVEGPEMYQGLGVLACWVVFFIAMSRILWWRGVKRYSGFGG
jgi:ABC-2 type transport system permease protein